MNEKENNAYNEYNETYNLETPIKEQDRKIQNVSSFNIDEQKPSSLVEINGIKTEFYKNGECYNHYFGWIDLPINAQEEIEVEISKAKKTNFLLFLTTFIFIPLTFAIVSPIILEEYTTFFVFILLVLTFILSEITSAFIFSQIFKKINKQVKTLFNQGKKKEEPIRLRQQRLTMNKVSPFNKNKLELNGRERLYDKPINAKSLHTGKNKTTKLHIFDRNKTPYDTVVFKRYKRGGANRARYPYIFFYLDGTYYHEKEGWFRYADYNDPILYKTKIQKDIVKIVYIVSALVILFTMIYPSPSQNIEMAILISVIFSVLSVYIFSRGIMKSNITTQVMKYKHQNSQEINK